MDLQSIWLKNLGKASYPPLRGRQQTDVVIIGGGLTGMTTGCVLAKAGLRVILLEARRIGSGTSGHAMGKVTAQHGLIYSRLSNAWGTEIAQAYASTQQNALLSVEKLISEREIECEWAWQDTHLTASSPEEERMLEREAKAASLAGLAMDLRSGEGCPFPAKRMLTLPSQGMLHPAAYLHGLAEVFTSLGGRIYEESRVIRIDTESAATYTGSVKASFLVIATSFPIINFPGWYFLRLTQSRSHILAISDAPDFQGMYLQLAAGGYSLRRYLSHTLLSGFDYRCGTEASRRHAELLRLKAQQFFPESGQTAMWHAQDCMSPDSLPYIGPYSPRTPNHFVASGFSKWGITNSMVAAQGISSSILGIPLAELEIYDPGRTMKHSFFAVSSNIGQMAVTIAKGLLKLGTPRCSHMGCKLKYISSTDSWDCPCHGSRYDRIGRIENSPAVMPAAVRPEKKVP